MRMAPCLLLAATLLSACELQEVTTARPEDFVVAEVVLIAGADSQYAYLQRSYGAGDATVPDASVSVTDEATGRVLSFIPVRTERCLQPLPNKGAGSCYAAATRNLPIRPSARYSLLVRLPGERELRGRTHVPGGFKLLSPTEYTYALPPETTLEVRWTAAADAWVYIVNVELRDIWAILEQRGVLRDTTGNAPLTLQGLSVSSGDTTLALPGELGLFDRFDASLHPLLVALQRGFPEGVSGAAMVAAADRNYVNWERGGGTFNPSGAVRVPSVQGDGTGVFGSLVPARFFFAVRRDSSLPSCL